MDRRIFLTGAASLALAGSTTALPAFAEASEGRASSRRRMVQTWVPPYAIGPSWTELRARYGGVGPRDALTHLGLQFWVPTAAGGLARSSRYGTISDAVVRGFVRWGRKHGIKVLLTVYNGEYGWDWGLARSAFGPNRQSFVAALVGEMQALDLDGIDIDLEASGFDPGAEDKAAFVRFVAALSEEVHQRGKHLGVDSFPYIWNGPSTTWWPDLLPRVDALVSMGYADLGRSAPGWQAYAWQRATAGRHAEKLLIGMPSDRNEWQGNTAVEQLDWLLPAKRGVGIAIWDAQNPAPAWQSEPVWRRLRQISAGRAGA